MSVTNEERLATIEWCKAFAAAGASMDPTAYLAYLTEDSVFEVPGMPPFVGKAAIAAQVNMFNSMLDSKKFDIDFDKVVVQADRVITQGTYTYNIKGNPKPIVVSARSEISKTPKDSLVTKHSIEGDFSEMMAVMEAMQAKMA